MWPPSRIATSVLAVAAVTVIGTLLVLGLSTSPPQPACGPATDGVVRATTLTVARRLRDEEGAGATVNRARRSIESDRLLASAVAAGDATAARAQALVLLFNHEHIVALRVLRDGQPLADVGGRLVLTPVAATLRRHAKAVGSVEFSVQDDMGYRLLALRLLGVRAVIRYRGRTVSSDIDAGGQELPPGGVVRIGGVRFIVATEQAGRFPVGRLVISLLIASPPSSLALASCPQVRADVLRDIAQRIYSESLSGPAVAVAVRAVHSSGLAAALSGEERARIRAAALGLVRSGHMIRLVVRAPGGATLADAGDRRPVLAAPTLTVRRNGRLVGRVLVSVQSVRGFVGVCTYLTGAAILVRAGARQIAGRVPGPAALPSSGTVASGGGSAQVASFAAAAYPTGPVTVYALVG